MGLTKAQLRDRSEKKLYEYLEAHGTEVKESKFAKKIWDKYPICARDICVLSAIIMKNVELLFTDYDSVKDSYPRKFSRKGKELERVYLESILKQISSYDSNLK